MSEEIAQHGDSGALSDIATAILLYLKEVDDDARTCRRHEATTGVGEDGRDLRLTRRIPWSSAARMRLQRAVAGLPGWRQSLFWGSDGERWSALEKAVGAHAARDPRSGIVRGTSWHGRPILVSARTLGAKRKRFLELELLLPHFSRDLPELPLHRVADGLQCHEHLLPEGVASALPLSAWARPEADTLRSYILRATPQELYARQCFSSDDGGY